MHQDIERCYILGVGVSAIHMQQALDCIAQWVEERHQHYICITPVHAIMDFRKDPELVKIANSSGLTTPDGMPVVWLLKLMGHRHVSRIYGPDLMLAVCQESPEKGYRHYFYGSAPGVPEKLASNLKKRFPGLQVVGTHSPPFRDLTPAEDQAITQEINTADPDIVWVGISTPKQERWMAAHLGKINAPVMIGVGAAFDFHAGLKKQAPRWMQRSGLEWFFRLITEPRRLWKRYLINNPLFLILILAQFLGLKRYTLE